MDCNLDVVRGLALILRELQMVGLQDQRGQTNGSPLETKFCVIVKRIR
jgi:hypothetical protein